MASTKGPAGHGRMGSSSLSGRLVIPAIPLPHVKRQAAAAASRNANANKSSSAVEKKQSISTPQPIDQAAAPADKSHANTASQEDKPTNLLAPKVSNTTGNTHPTASTQVAPPGDESASIVDEANVSTTNGGSPANIHEKNHDQQSFAGEKTGATHHDSVPIHTNGHVKTDSLSTARTEATSHPVKGGPTSPSPAGQHYPPALDHTAHRMSVAGIAGRDSANMNGHYPQHQSHPSHGNVHFGAFNDSGTSSPGLPLSGGIGPPPGMHGPDGRPHFLPQPRDAPGNLDMPPVAKFDKYGRPLAPFAPLDSHQPYGNGIRQATPQSVRGFPSPTLQENPMAYQQGHHAAASGGLMNNMPQPFQDSAPRALHHPPPMLHPTPPLGFPYNGSHAFGLVSFAQQAWLNGQYVDCILEVRDQRGLPNRIPMHHLILAQSPVLNTLLLEQGLQPLPYSLTPRPPLTLFLDTDNKWYWNDSLKVILHALYGFPLPGTNPQGHVDEMDAPFLMGPSTRCFQVSLSYAAGGHVFGLDTVLIRGVELATRHLNSQTVESALSFALESYIDKGTHEHFKYGDGSKILLHAVVRLLARKLSPSFRLDTSTTSDGVEYVRLPFDSASTPEPRTVTVKGTAVGHLSKGSNAQKPLNIQFGDMSVSDGQDEDEANISSAILSRILLNLPFSSLKHLVEFGPDVQTEWRRHIVQSVLQEREARRLRALDVVVSGAGANSESAREVLQSPEPQLLSNWSVLGWQEELVDTAEGPSLSRQWKPLKLAATTAVAEYP